MSPNNDTLRQIGSGFIHMGVVVFSQMHVSQRQFSFFSVQPKQLKGSTSNYHIRSKLVNAARTAVMHAELRNT